MVHIKIDYDNVMFLFMFFRCEVAVLDRLVLEECSLAVAVSTADSNPDCRRFYRHVFREEDGNASSAARRIFR